MENENRHNKGNILWIGGDLNVSLSQADRLRGVSRRMNVVDTIYKIASKNEMVDLW